MTHCCNYSRNLVIVTITVSELVSEWCEWVSETDWRMDGLLTNWLPERDPWLNVTNCLNMRCWIQILIFSYIRTDILWSNWGNKLKKKPIKTMFRFHWCCQCGNISDTAASTKDVSTASQSAEGTDSNVSCKHSDVIKWKHFSCYWPFVRGIHRWPVNFPHKGQWRGALMFSLICAWIYGWVINREAGDLRHYCGHYDVIVMYTR